MTRGLLLAPTLCLILGLAPALAQRTPPIAPKVQELALPPAVELPAPPALPPEVPDRPLTVQEAIEIALRSQPVIAAAAAGLSGAEARTQQSRSALGPSVAVGAGYSNTTSNTRSNLGASGASGFQVSGTVRQLVYDLNHTRDLVRQAAALERSANAALTRTQADLVLQVKLAFYRYLQAVELVGVAEADVRNRQEHVALTQARLNSGLGLPSDVVRAQTAYANAVYNLTVARAVALSTRVALAELMGIDPRTPFEPADSREPAIASPDLTALADLALRQRPEMAQARANIAAAAFGVSAAQTVNSPAVVGSVGVVNRGSDFPPGDRALTVGLSVEWTPVDSGLARGRVKEAQASLDLVQSQLAATRLAVIGDVAQAYVSLKAAEQRVTAAQAQVADAEESVRLTQGRYRAGIGVFMDVLDAQAALDTAKANLVNALSGVDQASAALWHAVGTVPQR